VSSEPTPDSTVEPVQRNTVAIVAVVLSALGLVGAIVFWLGVPTLLALAGLVTGYVARRRSPEGARAATWAIALGLLALVANIALIAAGAAGAFDD